MTTIYIYICHPLGNDVVENLRRINAIVRWYHTNSPGVVPVVPHYYAHSLDDANEYERKAGINWGLSLLEICSSIHVWGWSFERSDVLCEEFDTVIFEDKPYVSPGMKMEIAQATGFGKGNTSIHRVPFFRSPFTYNQIIGPEPEMEPEPEQFPDIPVLMRCPNCQEIINSGMSECSYCHEKVIPAAHLN